MVKQIILGLVGVVVGIIAGMIVMMSLHLASTLVYPLPDGVSFTSMELDNQTRLKEWFAILPSGAFLLAIACHGLGCMAGAFVAMLISGRRSMIPPLIVGAFFTVGGIMNLSSIPHPSWFPFVDLPIYVILAWIAGMILKRPSAEQTIPPA